MHPSVSQSTTADLATFISGVAAKCPEAEARAVSAVGIVVADRLVPLDDHLTRFAVEGSQPEPYTVDLGAHEGACTCPDYRRRAPQFRGKTYCKHVLSAVLYRALVQTGTLTPAAE